MKRFTTIRSLLFITACLSLFLLWSFSVIDITTELQGDVLHLDTGLMDVKVSVLNESKEPVGYYEPTDEYGHYKLTFNAVEGAAVYLKFEKEGYSTLVTEYFPLSKKEITDFSDVYLLSLTKPFQKKQFVQNINDLQIKIQDHPQSESESYEIVPVSEIAYFTFINRLVRDINSSKSKSWYEVAFIKQNGDEIKGYYFESN